MARGLKKIPSAVGKLRALFDTERNLRYAMRAERLDDCAVRSDIPGVTSDRITDREVVVSLTTYARRLDQVYLAVESIMQQTLPANRIVLWLGEDLKGVRLPAALVRQQARGLEVRYTRDLGPHTKLLPALVAFPESVIVTVDDDRLYDVNMLDRLVRAHELWPDVVVTNQAVRLFSSVEWSRTLETGCGRPSRHLLPIGVNGVLYPPGSLDDEVHNEPALRRLCPKADDIWFKAMALKAGTECVRVATVSPTGDDSLENVSVQDSALWYENVNAGRNREQYVAVMSEYGLTL